jgi:4-amino-4-deoxy-L-arabinose transferase-like glycosyltransferase
MRLKDTHLILVLIFLSLISILLCLAMPRLSPTFDEGGHLLSGIDIVTHRDTSFYYTNPPLIKSAAAGFALALGPELSIPQADPTGGSTWIPRFQNFMRTNQNNFLQALNLSRIIIVLFYFASTLLIWLWARKLYGKYSAWLALGLWGLSPVVLGLSNLLTMDVPLCFFALLSAYYISQWHEKKRDIYFVGFSFAYSFGVMAKFSMATLFPIFLLFFFWSCLKNKTKLKKIILYFIGSVVTFIVILNSCYLFQSTPTKLANLEFYSSVFSGTQSKIHYDTFSHTNRGNIFKTSLLGSIPLPIPKDFIRGLDEQMSHENSGFSSYMDGKWNFPGGWYSYYLYGMLVKMPEIFFCILLLFLFLFFFSDFKKDIHNPTTYLLIACGTFFFAFISLNKGINSHFRYVLPSLVFFSVVLSSVGSFLQRVRQKWVHIILPFFFIFPLASTYPRTISYFNWYAGGSKNGWKHLIDSNHDWGQDLLALSEWLKENPEVKSINLAFLGLMDPNIYGIKFDMAPPIYPREGSIKFSPPYKTTPREGWYAISGSFLAGLQAPTYDKWGNWHGVPFGGYRYLKDLKPKAYAGDSISIFYLSAKQASDIISNLKSNEDRFLFTE